MPITNRGFSVLEGTKVKADKEARYLGVIDRT